MSNFRTFILGLITSFGLPWLLLIVIPVINYQELSFLPYDKDRDGVEGYYPPATVHGQGQLIYIREGCVQCHTQMIRPTQLALDGWKKGWGQDQEPRPVAPVRSNTLRDYFGEKYAPLGLVRSGPDLANYGWRAPDRSVIHQMLYAPQSLHDWSNMPAYKHLYKVRKQQGPNSQSAIMVANREDAQQEIVPTAEAEALVDYLLSLKKDYLVPGTAVATNASAKK